MQHEITKKQIDKELSSTEEGNETNTFCLLCGASIEEAASHSLIDTLTTIPSKISVSEKLTMMIGYPLPREMLPSHFICPKCFHLINEVDVLEHRLKVYRREVLLSIEAMLEKNGIYFSSYKKFQRQYLGSNQHHEMQHATCQHLGSNVMPCQNQHDSNNGCYQNESQNYQSANQAYPLSSQNVITHHSQMHTTQNYHQHNIYLHTAAHSQPNPNNILQRPQEHHHHHLQNTNFDHNATHQHLQQVPLQREPHKNEIHPALKLSQEQERRKQQQQQLQQKQRSQEHMNQLHTNDRSLHSHQHNNSRHSNSMLINEPQNVVHTSQSSQISVTPTKHHLPVTCNIPHSDTCQQSVNVDINPEFNVQHISSEHIHLPKSDVNAPLLQGQAKYIQFPTKLDAGPDKDNIAPDTNDIHTTASESSTLVKDIQKLKNKREAGETSSLLLESNHHIPLISPENSDSLSSHTMSALLNYQHSTEREGSASLLNNFAQSYSSNFNKSNGEMLSSRTMKTMQEAVPNISTSEDNISNKSQQNLEAETWNHCSQTDIDSTSLNNSSIAHIDCDIDIEKCDNIIENVSSTSHKQLPSSSVQEAQVEVEKIDIVNQTSFNIAKKNSCKENAFGKPTRPSNPITSTSNDLNVFFSSPSSSPPARSLGNAEGLRNVQDATEYHKPTLLGKNIKAKKHAKLQICRQCDQVFSNRQALIRHIERRHKSIGSHYSCDTCHKKFNSEKSLNQHTRTHKTYPCKICSMIFLKKNKLKKHLAEHAEQSLTCKTCSKVTGSMQALISHLKTHDRIPQTFACSICSKNFTCKRNLNQHLLIHTGEKPFRCENCRRGFRNRSNMVTHYSICVGKFRYICATCGKGFLLKSLYERHSAEHEGRYAHKCSVCYKGFGKSSDLRQHFRSHGIVGQTQSNCSVCTNLNSSACNKAIKPKDAKTICEICGKRINRKDTMKDHLSFHAGKRHHACHLCTMTYYYKSNLSFHIKTVHFKKFPFSCTWCRKAFSRSGNYRLHMRTHTGERPYQCKSCGKAFTSSSNYKRHLKCHVTRPLISPNEQNQQE